MAQRSAHGGKPTINEATERLMTQRVIDQEDFNVLFGLGRIGGYRATQTGLFPVIEFNGKTRRFPTAPLRKALYLDEPNAA